MNRRYDSKVKLTTDDPDQYITELIQKSHSKSDISSFLCVTERLKSSYKKKKNA